MKLKRTRHDPEFEARKRMKEAGLKLIENIAVALRYPSICSRAVREAEEEMLRVQESANILDPQEDK